MNCRNRPNTKQQKAIKDFARLEVEKELETRKIGSVRRIYKMICYALNRNSGFGLKRLQSLISYVDKTMKEESESGDFWRDLDRVVIDEIGLEFERETYENVLTEKERTK